MFMVAIGCHIMHTQAQERIDEIKKKFALEVGETRTVDYKGGTVTVFPDGNFIVNGRDAHHCQQIHDEVLESFKRRYL
tara:strand:- start:666 stop:899 length:234 start_codon:yes stop_codon:yes gene_type:complete